MGTQALPRGVTALLFEEARRRRAFERAAVGVLDAAGYSEVILPILDYFEPYQALLTSERRDELYRFVDRDGELLALRGDFTPLLARLLASRLQSLELPLRLFYRGDLVRYQEDRPGRLREYSELGAELLGVPEGSGDEEILRLVLRLVRLETEAPIRVVLGFAGALDFLLKGASCDGWGAAVRAVSRRDRRQAAAVSAQLLEVVETGMPRHPEALGESAAARLADLESMCARLQDSLDVDAVELSIDLAEFADDILDPELVAASGSRPYYDGLVFRVYLGGAASSVARGGRYDRLFGRLGADLSAVGFSLSFERYLQAAQGAAQ